MVGAAFVLALGAGCTTTRTTKADGATTGSGVLPSAQGTSGLPQPVGRRVWSLPTGKKAPYSHGGPVYVASVYGIYRQGDYARLALGLTVAGEGSTSLTTRPVGLLAAEHEHTESGYDDTGLTLVDPVAEKAYLVASDRRNRCLCSYSPDVVAGVTTLATATFAAPPENVSTMDVVLPKFGVVPSVPVTDGAPPRSITSPHTAPPGNGGLPPVMDKGQASSDPPAHAPVVDIEAPVSNLDESVTEAHGKVVLAADVLFAYDKATLTEKARSRIAEAAGILRRRAHGTVRVNGYTDGKGSTAYNRGLSERRAEAVRRELATRLHGTGIRLVARGYGEADPVAPNTRDGKDNPMGRALNRRVETVYRQRETPSKVPATQVSAHPKPDPKGELVLPNAVASKPAKVPGLAGAHVELYDLYRHGRLVTLNFGVVAPKGQAMSLQGTFSKTSRLDGNATGVSLVDRENSRRYTTARYARNWFCTTWLGPYDTVYAGQTFYLTATFAAPPAGITSVDVDVPHVGTFHNVRLS